MKFIFNEALGPNSAKKSFPRNCFDGTVNKASWIESNSQGGYKTFYSILTLGL